MSTQYVNINENYGDHIGFTSLKALEMAILDCGYELPEDGLEEGRDYEIEGGTDHENFNI